MPSFWSNPFDLFPKQQHRWIITFENDTTNSNINIEERVQEKDGKKLPKFFIPPYFIKSTDRPHFEIGSIQAKYLFSHTFNFPKRLTWKPITISFNDILDRSGMSPLDGEVSIVDNSARKKGAWETLYTRPEAKKPDKGSSWDQISPNETGIFLPERMSMFGTSGSDRYPRSTQNLLFKLLQIMGYFSPDELESYSSDPKETDQLLRIRNYTFKRNMTKALSSQGVDLLKNNLEDYQKKENNILKSEEYKKDFISIHELDEYGNTIERWNIYNPILVDYKSDKLDYSNTNVLGLTITLAYDWAELVPVSYATHDKYKTTYETIKKLNEQKKALEELEKDFQENLSQFDQIKRRLNDAINAKDTEAAIVAVKELKEVQERIKSNASSIKKLEDNINKNINTAANTTNKTELENEFTTPDFERDEEQISKFKEKRLTSSAKDLATLEKKLIEESVNNIKADATALLKTALLRGDFSMVNAPISQTKAAIATHKSVEDALRGVLPSQQFTDFKAETGDELTKLREYLELEQGKGVIVQSLAAQYAQAFSGVAPGDLGARLNLIKESGVLNQNVQQAFIDAFKSEPISENVNDEIFDTIEAVRNKTIAEADQILEGLAGKGEKERLEAQYKMADIIMADSKEISLINQAAGRELMPSNQDPFKNFDTKYDRFIETGLLEDEKLGVGDIIPNLIRTIEEPLIRDDGTKKDGTRAEDYSDQPIPKTAANTSYTSYADVAADYMDTKVQFIPKNKLDMVGPDEESWTSIPAAPAPTPAPAVEAAPTAPAAPAPTPAPAVEAAPTAPAAPPAPAPATPIVTILDGELESLRKGSSVSLADRVVGTSTPREAEIVLKALASGNESVVERLTEASLILDRVNNSDGFKTFVFNVGDEEVVIDRSALIAISDRVSQEEMARKGLLESTPENQSFIKAFSPSITPAPATATAPAIPTPAPAPAPPAAPPAPAVENIVPAASAKVEQALAESSTTIAAATTDKKVTSRGTINVDLSTVFDASKVDTSVLSAVQAAVDTYVDLITKDKLNRSDDSLRRNYSYILSSDKDVPIAGSDKTVPVSLLRTAELAINTQIADSINSGNSVSQTARNYLDFYLVGVGAAQKNPYGLLVDNYAQQLSTGQGDIATQQRIIQEISTKLNVNSTIATYVYGLALAQKGLK